MILFLIAVPSFTAGVLSGRCARKRRTQGFASLPRFIFTGLRSGNDSPSAVSLVTCHVRWSLSVFVTTLVAVTFLPVAALAVTLIVHLLPSLVQTPSPNPPLE